MYESYYIADEIITINGVQVSFDDEGMMSYDKGVLETEDGLNFNTPYNYTVYLDGKEIGKARNVNFSVNYKEENKHLKSRIEELEAEVEKLSNRFKMEIVQENDYKDFIDSEFKLQKICTRKDFQVKLSCKDKIFTFIPKIELDGSFFTVEQE